MKQILAAYAFVAFPLLLQPAQSNAQAQRPSAEFTAVWDASLNRWKNTIQTYQMSYTPEYTLTSRSAKYLTTCTGFTPIVGDVYQSRFYWEPRMTYSRIQIDSIHVNGTTTPVRFDQYDRSIAGRVSYTQSSWGWDSPWVPVQKSVSMTDELGITRSVVNHSIVAGELALTDSTHVDVMQDIKGNVGRTNAEVR